MNSRTIGLRVAGAIFGLMSLAQLLRLIVRAEVRLAGHPIPLWPSAIAVVLAGSLSLWMWTLSGRPDK